LREVFGRSTFDEVETARTIGKANAGRGKKVVELIVTG
jgi:hypothetical protein